MTMQQAKASTSQSRTTATMPPRRHHHGANHNSVSVYAPGFKYVVNVPQHAVHHMPAAGLSVTRLVLCANYDARNPSSSCPMGNRCKFVHADTRLGTQHDIHVNYAWRSLDEVTYPRLEGGLVLKVAAPNSKVATDVMESHLVLQTRALQSTRRPLSHCAHYYFNRTCNLGADCQFIHAVFIDPEAKPHQRAPVPSQLGEGRELQLSKRQRERQESVVGSVVGSFADSSLRATATDEEEGGVVLSQAGGSLTSMPSTAASATAASDLMESPRSSAAASCGKPVQRYRHNPYSLRATCIADTRTPVYA